MGARHALAAGQIGDGARHAQHAGIAARRQPERVGGLRQQALAVGIRCGVGLQGLAIGFGVAADGGAGIARSLPGPCGGDAGGDLRAGLGRRRQREIGGRQRRHLDVQIDAVEQRPRQFALIFAGAARGAGAGQARIAQVAAAAGVHGGDQLHARRIGDMGGGARHLHLAGFQRLAQAVEHAALELGQLIEEQHAQMCEGDLAGPRLGAAADQRRHRGRMVRAAEGAAALQLAALQLAGDGGDHRNLQRLGRGEIGQYASQCGRQQRLAGARRPAHQQIVAAGRGNLDAALGRLLPLDVGHVRPAPQAFRCAALRLGQDGLALQMIDQREQIGGGEHVHLAGPGGFRALGRRADQPLLAGGGMQGGKQHAGHRQAGAIEAKLPHRDKFIERIGRQHAHRGEQAERDGQIIMAAFLGQIGRRQIDDDALGRQRQADGVEGGGDPLAAFLHRLVGQADGDEAHRPGRDLHLHIDAARLQPQERHRADMGHHPPSPPTDV